MARVVLENLSKTFVSAPGREVRAVQRLNLVIEDKELLVLVGPSGSGKTTTLRLIAGLEEVTEGAVSIDGEVVNDLPAKDRDIAMVFQNFALYPHLTVFQNLAFGLTLRKFPKADIQQRVQEAAEMLGLAGCLDRKPGALSGGEQQRVALGRAIVRRPRVFLFDEPLSNLDAPKRAQMRAEIARLHSRLGATILYVTHDQAEAMTLGNRIAVMNAGEIQQIAEPMALYDAPANVFVAGFVGSPPMNLFHGLIQEKSPILYFVERSEKGQAAAEPFNVRICEEQAVWLKQYVGKPLVLGLRPEHLFAQTVALGQASADFVTANLEMVEPRGADTLLHLDTGTHRFTARASSREAWSKPGRILVAFDMRKALFFHPDMESSLTSERGQVVRELSAPEQ